MYQCRPLPEANLYVGLVFQMRGVDETHPRRRRGHHDGLRVHPIPGEADPLQAGCRRSHRKRRIPGCVPSALRPSPPGAPGSRRSGTIARPPSAPSGAPPEPITTCTPVPATTAAMPSATRSSTPLLQAARDGFEILLHRRVRTLGRRSHHDFSHVAIRRVQQSPAFGSRQHGDGPRAAGGAQVQNS